tara:strand:+ start:349 stop:720 length:372 start_codon:yes stop_codon:yes gene_type:complete
MKHYKETAKYKMLKDRIANIKNDRTHAKKMHKIELANISARQKIAQALVTEMRLRSLNPIKINRANAAYLKRNKSIASDYANGVRVVELAKKHAVSAQTIYMVIRRREWHASRGLEHSYIKGV